jgi:hypothetical protein
MKEFAKDLGTEFLNSLANIVLGEQYVEQIGKGVGKGIQDTQGSTPKTTIKNNRGTGSTGTVTTE